MLNLWNKRAASRTVMLRKARGRVGNEVMDVCIREVSSTGMLLQANYPPAPGQTVTIFGAGFSLAGRVIWVKGRRFGVTLAEPLNIEVLRPPETPPVKRPRIAAHNPMRRPGFGSHQFTPDEAERAISWSKVFSRRR